MSTLKSRLVGLAALVATVAIVVGAPLLLWMFHPVTPSVLADLASKLASPDDGSGVLTVLTLVGWLAWAYFTLAVLLEVIALLRDRPAPNLPGFGIPQHFARRLVATAALLFVAAPMTAGVAHATPKVDTHQRPAVTAQATHGTHDAKKAAKPAEMSKSPSSYTVQAGDSLRSIAQDRLGSAERWEEIFTASRGTVQADGQRLTDPDHIEAGWTLTLPSASAQRTYTVQAGDSLRSIAQRHLGDPERWEEIFTASRGTLQPDGQRLTDPDHIETGWTLTLPSASVGKQTAPKSTKPATKTPQRTSTTTKAPKPATPKADKPEQTSPTQQANAPQTSTPSRAASPVASAPASHATTTAPATSAASPTADTTVPGLSQEAQRVPAPLPTAPATAPSTVSDEDPWPARTPAGVGAILAAGVVSLIAARRWQQQRSRRRGEAVPMPDADTLAVEVQLRAAADSFAVEDVDVALRRLAESCAVLGEPLPAVRFARLTDDRLDLYLEEPAQLPEPWYGTANQMVWTLDASDRLEGDEGLHERVPAPYPSLVTIGHDMEDGHVLVDLENLGSLSVSGSPAQARAVMAAMAVELATSRWADDLQVSVVGGFAELEDALGTGRIRYVPTLAVLKDQLSHHATADRDALAHVGDEGLRRARVSGVATDSWTPEIVMLCGETTPADQALLAELLDTQPRIALATVAANHPPMGEWALSIPPAGPDHAELKPLGLQLRAQQIVERDYAAILEAAAVAAIPTTPRPAVVTSSAWATISTLPPAPRRIAENVDEQPTTAAATSPDDDAVQEVEETASEQPELESPAPADETDAAASEGAPEDEQADEPGQGAEVLSIEDYARLRGVEDETSEDEVPTSKPIVRVLGPVRVDHAKGSDPGSKRRVLTEFAAFLALHPGSSIEALDEAVWPNRASEGDDQARRKHQNTRNTATSQLRKWLGADRETGEDYFPKYRYELVGVTTDWAVFQDLVGDDVTKASTTALAEALSLVRGRPFEGTAGDRAQVRRNAHRYAWAEVERQEMTSAIIDAAEELATRWLNQGRYGHCEQAVALGIRMNPGVERLWRIRILAAHQARNKKAEDEAIQRLLAIVEDDLECDLEPETTAFLEALADSDTRTEQLRAMI